jgi:hypothetical protein
MTYNDKVIEHKEKYGDWKEVIANVTLSEGDIAWLIKSLTENDWSIEFIKDLKNTMSKKV